MITGLLKFFLEGSQTKELKNQLTKARIIPKRRAEKKSRTANSGTKRLVSIIIKVFITKVNKPKVKIFIGRVRKIRKGRRKALRTPKIIEVTIATLKEATCTPGVT